MTGATRVTRSDEIAHLLLDASLDGVAGFDHDLRFTYWNRGMERIYGLREDEAIGRRAPELLPFLAERGEDEHLRRALRGEEIALEARRYHVRETQRSGFAEATYSPLRDDQGALVGGIVVVRDVTEQREIEERAKETESRFRRMADCSPVLLWMSGTDGLCNFFNQTWLTFTGRTLEEENGVGWAEGVHAMDFQRCMDTYLDAFNARRPFEMEYRLRRADGEYRWVLDRGAPRYNPDGSFAGFIGSCIDITERRALESALEDALAKAESTSKLKSEFLANISHELRTPLNALINVPLSTLREFPVQAVWECPSCGDAFKRTEDDADGPDASNACPDCNVEMTLTSRPLYVGDSRKTVHFLERMVQSSRHLLKLVNDILDFAKIDAGQMHLFLSEVSVGGLIEALSETMTPLAEQRKLSLTFPVLAEPIVLVADGVKLVQVLINLLSNAIKFTPEGGVISLEVSETCPGGEPCVEFALRDSGIGVPADKLDVIFESFRQADGSHTRAHQGTGLGLSIAKQLIELHGGRIWVESRVGEGSVFRFVLPKAARCADAPPAALSARKGKVLVIDDDMRDLEPARLALERDGFEVARIEPAKAAPDVIHRERPDCILLDVMMPDLSGLTLLQRFKESDRTSETPVIVTTAYPQGRQVIQQFGGLWVPKPCSEQTLVAKVKETVGRTARRAEMPGKGGQ